MASHSGLQWDSHTINDPAEIWDFLAAETNVVAIDEVQFFDWTVADIASSPVSYTHLTLPTSDLV